MKNKQNFLLICVHQMEDKSSKKELEKYDSHRFPLLGFGFIPFRTHFMSKQNENKKKHWLVQKPCVFFAFLGLETIIDNFALIVFKLTEFESNCQLFETHDFKLRPVYCHSLLKSLFTVHSDSSLLKLFQKTIEQKLMRRRRMCLQKNLNKMEG